MDFKRSALGLAIGSIAAVALSLTATTASALDVTGARYFAADSTAATADKASGQHQSRRERRAAQREANRREKMDNGSYTRDVERTDTEKGDHSVGHEATITNTETGKTVTHEQTMARDPESGAITRTNEVTGSGGKTYETSTTATKTDDGHTAIRTVTTPDGQTHTQTSDVSKDPDSQSVTKTVTGGDRTRESTATRTDDGYTRTTEYNSGATKEVTATKASDGTWDREVDKTRGDGKATPEPDSSSADTSTED